MVRLIVLISAFFIGSTFSQGKEYKVKEAPFIIKKEINAEVYSTDAAEIKIPAGQWQKWVVEEAVSHGSIVKKDDIIIRFEAKDFDTALITKRRNLEIQELNLQKLRKTYETNLKKMELELKKVKLDREFIAKQTKIFEEKGYKQAVVAANQLLEDAKSGLEYQQEELKQLEKMYKEDKITEETEEIVIKRQRDYVKRMEDRLKNAELTLEQAKAYKLPQSKFGLEYKNNKALLDGAQAAYDWEIFKKVEKLKLEAAEAAFKKASESLNEMMEERKSLEIKAPKDGIVFYGSMSMGKWTNKAGRVYKKGTALTPKALIFTVINPNSFKASAKIKIEDFESVADNSAYFFSAPGAEVREVKLTSREDVPDGGLYGAEFSIGDNNGLFHGTTGKVQVIRVVSEKALAVLQSSVKTEPLNPSKKFIRLKKNGKEEKVYVKTGQSSNGKVIILEGISAGDTILK